MPRFNEIINNFINGEVSPKIYGRMDSEIYKRSCRELKNMIVHPQGGASRRVGTQFISDIVTSSDTAVSALVPTIETLNEGARLIPFVFSSDEKYIIVFNKEQDSVTGQNIVHYFFVDDNNVPNSTPFTAGAIEYAAGVTDRVTTNISTAYDDDALQDNDVLAEMQYAQAGAVLTIVHEDFPPIVIVRTARGVLAMGNYLEQFQASASTEFGPMPFIDQNVSEFTLGIDNAAVGTGRTLTYKNSGGTPTAFFQAGHVGTMFATLESGTIGVCVVTAVAAPPSTTATVEVVRPYASTTDQQTWYEGAWSDYRGWPRTVNYWNSSLVFGGSPTFPDRIWRSEKFDIFEMDNEVTLNPGVTQTSDDPFKADLAAGNGISKINFLADSGRDLIVGCLQKEISISSLDVDEVSVKPQTGYGCEYIQPAIVGDVPVFVQKGFRKIREIIFEERKQGYVAPEVTFLAEHITRKSRDVLAGATLAPKIKHMQYQPLDNSILWVIDNNGLLYGATMSREQSVTAFHYHDVDGTVESIAVVPSKDNTFDELYMIVKRTINSVEVRYLEKLGGEFYESSLNPDVDDRTRIPVFADSANMYRRTTATFWAQLKDGTDADLADGSTTGTETGTVTYSNKRANFDGSTYVSYDGTDNADHAQVGTIRFKASIPLALFDNTIFSISESNASANNLIRLRTNTSGGLLLTINDSTGSAIINDVLFGTLTNVGLYDIELDYDLTAGATRIFVNGIQLGSTDTSTGTRSTSIDNVVIGANYDGSDPWNGFLYDFQIFDSVQHTADHDVFDFQPLGNTVYKLDHLEGESVAVTADGIYIGDFTVSGGEIADIGDDYDDETTTLVVGVKYEHKLEIQPIDLGSGIGSAHGSIKRIDRTVIRFRASAAAKVGADSSNVEDIVFRDNDTPLSDPIVLVTDDKRVDFQGDYSRTARAVVLQNVPLPCNVTCISFRGVEADV